MTIYGDVSESSVYIRYINRIIEVFYNMIFLVKDTGIPEEKELRVLAIGVEPTAF